MANVDIYNIQTHCYLQNVLYVQAAH